MAPWNLSKLNGLTCRNYETVKFCECSPVYYRDRDNDCIILALGRDGIFGGDDYLYLLHGRMRVVHFQEGKIKSLQSYFKKHERYGNKDKSSESRETGAGRNRDK